MYVSKYRGAIHWKSNEVKYRFSYNLLNRTMEQAAADAIARAREIAARLSKCACIPYLK